MLNYAKLSLLEIMTHFISRKTGHRAQEGFELQVIISL